MYLRSQNFVFVKHVLVVGECCIFIDNDQQGNACPHFTGTGLFTKTSNKTAITQRNHSHHQQWGSLIQTCSPKRNRGLLFVVNKPIVWNKCQCDILGVLFLIDGQSPVWSYRLKFKLWSFRVMLFLRRNTYVNQRTKYLG